MQRLYDVAMAMEQLKIADLTTRISGKDDHIRLELRVPGKGLDLVSFDNLLSAGKERGGEIKFWPTGDILAPGTRHRVDELIDADTSQKARYRRLSQKKYDWDAILAAIQNAYHEASGHEIEAASADD